MTDRDASFATIQHVAEGFGLGRLLAPPVRVLGGRSNELLRLATERGEFAIKRMIVNAGRASFVSNVEAAYEVEQRAWAAGIAMPEPIPDSAGRALMRVEGSLYRAHRWVVGRGGVGTARDAVRLLANIHVVGERRMGPSHQPAWHSQRWGTDIERLARQVSAVPEDLLIVTSHRDLDRKNTIRRDADDELMAVDWDAAGPTAAVSEAIGVSLDWSAGDPQSFADAIELYEKQSGIEVPNQAWAFGGWVTAQGRWLDYNAQQRADTALGRREAAQALARLQQLAANIDRLLRGRGSASLGPDRKSQDDTSTIAPPTLL